MLKKNVCYSINMSRKCAAKLKYFEDYKLIPEILKKCSKIEPVASKLISQQNNKVYLVKSKKDNYILKESSFDDKKEEVQSAKITLKAAKLNASPKVYDIFYGIDTTGRPIQYILMEKYDQSLDKYLKKASKKQSEDATKKAIEIMKKLVDNGIFCADNKLENFVIKKGIVKMIDFGIEGCSSKKYNKKLFLQAMIMKLLYLTKNKQLFKKYISDPEKTIEFINKNEFVNIFVDKKVIKWTLQQIPNENKKKIIQKQNKQIKNTIAKRLPKLRKEIQQMLKDPDISQAEKKRVKKKFELLEKKAKI